MTTSFYRVVGGNQLKGEVLIRGAKNAVTKQLVASLLTDQPCVLSNVPRLSEVNVTLDMLASLGTSYEWLSEDSLRVHTPSITSNTVEQKYSGVNRIPILLLGPLLNRAREVMIPTLGGCQIGPRPLDFHVQALESLGARIIVNDLDYHATAPEGLKGAIIRLPYPSVGATENVILAASLARGVTVIENAAVEPEVIDTILMLQNMGALIQVDVDRRIIIEGVERLRGAHHRVIGDRLEAASFAAAAVATNGRVKVKGVPQEHLITFLNALRKAGGGFRGEPDGISFMRESRDLRAIHLETDVHPGFMTDWQQPFVVMLTQAQGVSIVHETVYENRFGYTKALNAMGATIDLTSACLGHKPCRFQNANHAHSCIVRGATALHGEAVEIPDLRAGFAYLIAALVAEDESHLCGIHYLERGYADLPAKLTAIGGEIKLLKTDEGL